ncbi:hypothetical protein SKAU_G00244620 [Synaphobranchus kaupii]|uniref:Uncharacterized protein n=1 Tax=Synaphobranchus kaupii TaxID=118154 RepID=A0A9Q1F1M6_SYNKA|nr:hypothetical protein SKAU_G00244620 [Synaphobranchus kaupii]
MLMSTVRPARALFRPSGSCTVPRVRLYLSFQDSKENRHTSSSAPTLPFTDRTETALPDRRNLDWALDSYSPSSPPRGPMDY